jgi:hypothetical protein
VALSFREQGFVPRLDQLRVDAGATDSGLHQLDHSTVSVVAADPLHRWVAVKMWSVRGGAVAPDGNKELSRVNGSAMIALMPVQDPEPPAGSCPALGG